MWRMWTSDPGVLRMWQVLFLRSFGWCDVRLKIGGTGIRGTGLNVSSLPGVDESTVLAVLSEVECHVNMQSTSIVAAVLFLRTGSDWTIIVAKVWKNDVDECYKDATRSFSRNAQQAWCLVPRCGRSDWISIRTNRKVTVLRWKDFQTHTTDQWNTHRAALTVAFVTAHLFRGWAVCVGVFQGLLDEPWCTTERIAPGPPGDTDRLRPSVKRGQSEPKAVIFWSYGRWRRPHRAAWRGHHVHCEICTPKSSQLVESQTGDDWTAQTLEILEVQIRKTSKMRMSRCARRKAESKSRWSTHHLQHQRNPMEKPGDTVTRSRRKNLWEAAPKKGEKLRSSNLLQTAQWPLENCCYFQKRLSCYSFRSDVRFARCKSIGLQWGGGESRDLGWQYGANLPFDALRNLVNWPTEVEVGSILRVFTWFSEVVSWGVLNHRQGGSRKLYIL